MRRITKRTRLEPAISLINIIFLILIFFMVTSTLSRPTLPSLQFVQTTGLECCAGSDVLQVNETGDLFVLGEPIGSIDTYLSMKPDDEPIVRIVPDRRLPAHKLIELVGVFQGQGAQRIVIVTENTQ